MNEIESQALSKQYITFVICFIEYVRTWYDELEEDVELVMWVDHAPAGVQRHVAIGDLPIGHTFYRVHFYFSGE